MSASVFISTILFISRKENMSGDCNVADNFDGEQEEKEVLVLGGAKRTKKGTECG